MAGWLLRPRTMDKHSSLKVTSKSLLLFLRRRKRALRNVFCTCQLSSGKRAIVTSGARHLKHSFYAGCRSKHQQQQYVVLVLGSLYTTHYPSPLTQLCVVRPDYSFFRGKGTGFRLSLFLSLPLCVVSACELFSPLFSLYHTTISYVVSFLLGCNPSSPPHETLKHFLGGHTQVATMIEEHLRTEMWGGCVRKSILVSSYKRPRDVYTAMSWS